jgi:UDP-glucose 4-epimerase
MTRALVTGGAGFIGSHIAAKLVGRGIETIIVDDLSMGKRENVPSGADFVGADVLDYETLKKLVGDVDAVFHLAARVSIRNSIVNFYDDAQVNILGTLNVLKAIADKKLRDDKKTKLVYASSMAVYGDAERLPLAEDHRLNPISPYGISKLTGERYCLRLANDCGFDAVALRYFNTYGPKQTLTPYVGVITIFINRLLKNQPPLIFGDGRQIRDFVYVGDVAEASILAMEKDIGNQVINVGTGRGTSVEQIAQILIDRIAPGTEASYGPKQAGEPADSVADTSKIEKMLGFIPVPFNEENLQEVIDFNKRTSAGSLN